MTGRWLFVLGGIFSAGIFSAGILSAGSVGCTPQTNVSNKPLDPTQVKLIKINMAYSQYTREKGKSPRGPAQIKSLLAKMGDPDDILKSDRDGQPFVVCWGVDLFGPTSWAKSRPVYAYERTATDGTWFVLLTVSKVEELSDEEFRQSSFPPGHEPSF